MEGTHFRFLMQKAYFMPVWITKMRIEISNFDNEYRKHGILGYGADVSVELCNPVNLWIIQCFADVIVAPCAGAKRLRLYRSNQ